MNSVKLLRKHKDASWIQYSASKITNVCDVIRNQSLPSESPTHQRQNILSSDWFIDLFIILKSQRGVSKLLEMIIGSLNH